MTMESSAICLFLTILLVPYLICSATSGDDCALGSLLQIHAAIGFLSVLILVQGERVSHGLMLLYLLRAEHRRVLGSEFLTLNSLASMLKGGVLRFRQSISHHFSFHPRMLPFLPHFLLNKEKIPRAGEGNKLARTQKEWYPARNQNRDGKTFAEASGTCIQ